MAETDLKSRVTDYWNKLTRSQQRRRSRWWESPVIIEHVNRLVCGENGLFALSAGLTRVVKRRSEGRSYEQGVSVGCGVGRKEMELIKAGLVRRFDLYNLSDERIRLGRELAHEWGLEEVVVFRNENAFENTKPASVDFVHWNNSLHHMLDVEAAVSWSLTVLRPGGLFYMDDFVGPARFQWSEDSLQLASRIRNLLPKTYLRNARYGKRPHSTRIGRSSLEFMLANDPSEAAQSNLILGAVRRCFPKAEITLTGGLVCNLVLADILHNFQENDEVDLALLKFLLLMDELSIQKPGLDNHYATAFAWKS